MKINIITVFYNSSHCYKDFFELIDNAGVDFTLTIVDNASDMEHLEKLTPYLEGRNFRTILNGKNLMFTPAVNQGLSIDSDYNLLLNPDCFLKEKGWLKSLISNFENIKKDHNIGIAGVKLIGKDGLINHAGGFTLGDKMQLQNNMHRGYGQNENMFGIAENVSWVTGACFLISKETLETVGALPMGEKFEFQHYHSDREYCWLAESVGIKTFYIPVKVGHGHGKSSKK